MVGEQLEKKMGLPSLGALVAAFCGRDELNEEEEKKLEFLIQELEQRQKNDGE